MLKTLNAFVKRNHDATRKVVLKNINNSNSDDILSEVTAIVNKDNILDIEVNKGNAYIVTSDETYASVQPLWS